jgi:carbon monoxide dehydrogenase subunit G
MKLENDFTVPAPVEQVWPALLDIARVGGCLPGAVIETNGGDGTFRGTMKVELGQVTSVYEGTARLQDVDADTHTVSIAVQAREAKGQGTATAVITNRLIPHDGGTRVVAETDLNLSGRQAQFGRGIIEDVAGKLLGEFATRFQAELLAGDPEPPAAGTEPAAAAQPEALDLGGVPAGSLKTRALGAALAAGALAAVVLVVRGKRAPKRHSLFHR